MGRVKEWAASGAPRWYCLVVGIFLGVRAVTTLLGGASFAMPGDGWRAVLQLASVGILAGGLVGGTALGTVRRRVERVAVAVVGAVYLAATALESERLGTAPYRRRCLELLESISG